MIITLQDAKTIDPSVTQDRLDAYESAIRQLTNNNFQVMAVRSKGFTVEGNVVTFDDNILTDSLHEGETVEINDSRIIDGLYIAESVIPKSITLDRNTRKSGTFNRAIVTLVVYPDDIKEGVRRLIAYDKRMGNKTGIKSETISRMRLDYYDVNSNETIGGYPANLMSFIKKYIKINWGS